MSAWSCQVRVDIQLISWNASGYSQLHRLTGGNLLTFFLTYLLTLDILSDIFSDIVSDILSDISCDILPHISLWHSAWHLFWHSFWHSFWHISWHSVWHYFWHIFWHSVWHSFWHSVWHSFWHIFWHSFWHSVKTFFLTYLLTFYLAVKVRQGTLSADGRGWGPAGNAGRGWGPAGNTERRWSRCLQCMSGREHWTWRLAVEGWQHDDEEGRKEGRRKETTDLKSNNPHLTGGETHACSGILCTNKPQSWHRASGPIAQPQDCLWSKVDFDKHP